LPASYRQDKTSQTFDSSDLSTYVNEKRLPLLRQPLFI